MVMVVVVGDRKIKIYTHHDNFSEDDDDNENNEEDMQNCCTKCFYQEG